MAQGVYRFNHKKVQRSKKIKKDRNPRITGKNCSDHFHGRGHPGRDDKFELGASVLDPLHERRNGARIIIEIIKNL